jgi:hypothetical protein
MRKISISHGVLNTVSILTSIWYHTTYENTPTPNPVQNLPKSSEAALWKLDAIISYIYSDQWCHCRKRKRMEMYLCKKDGQPSDNAKKSRSPHRLLSTRADTEEKGVICVL